MRNLQAQALTTLVGAAAAAAAPTGPSEQIAADVEPGECSDRYSASRGAVVGAAQRAPVRSTPPKGL
jgi:hypothetical protein